jgi:hypothetical protein
LSAVTAMTRRPFTKSDDTYPGEQALEAMIGAAKNAEAKADRTNLLEGPEFFMIKPPDAGLVQNP